SCDCALSATVGLPPWQSTHWKLFSRWMSGPVKSRAGIDSRCSDSAAWQVRQEFGSARVWAGADPAAIRQLAAKPARNTRRAMRPMTLPGDTADDGEDDEVREAEQRNERERRAALPARGASIQKRHEHQKRRGQAEGNHPHALALEHPDVT